MQFLRGDFRGARSPTRPPWSVAEGLFTSRCTRCGDCLAACETGVLTAGRGGFPTVDFGRGECTFCGACADSCGDRAIEPVRGASPWNLAAQVTGDCLARQGVVCRTCSEQCEAGAIRFRMVVGGVALPEFDAAACNGCGACHAPCPVRAIAIREPLENRQ
jgi:ferredoxin-type protein NapF